MVKCIQYDKRNKCPEVSCVLYVKVIYSGQYTMPNSTKEHEYHTNQYVFILQRKEKDIVAGKFHFIFPTVDVTKKSFNFSYTLRWMSQFEGLQR